LIHGVKQGRAKPAKAPLFPGSVKPKPVFPATTIEAQGQTNEETSHQTQETPAATLRHVPDLASHKLPSEEGIGKPITLLHLSDMQFGRHHEFLNRICLPTSLIPSWNAFGPTSPYCERKTIFSLVYLSAQVTWPNGLGKRNSRTLPTSSAFLLSDSKLKETAWLLFQEIMTSIARIAYVPLSSLLRAVNQ
jgi:hypothetical protein